MGDLTYPSPAQAVLVFSHPRRSHCHRWKCGHLAAILLGVSAHQDTGIASAAGCSWAGLSLPCHKWKLLFNFHREKNENEPWHFQSEKQNITLTFGNLSHLPDMERLITVSRNIQ